MFGFQAWGFKRLLGAIRLSGFLQGVLEIAVDAFWDHGGILKFSFGCPRSVGSRSPSETIRRAASFKIMKLGKFLKVCYNAAKQEL